MFIVLLQIPDCAAVFCDDDGTVVAVESRCAVASRVPLPCQRTLFPILIPSATVSRSDSDKENNVPSNSRHRHNPLHREQW